MLVTKNERKSENRTASSGGGCVSVGGVRAGGKDAALRRRKNKLSKN